MQCFIAEIVLSHYLKESEREHYRKTKENVNHTIQYFNSLMYIR